MSPRSGSAEGEPSEFSQNTLSHSQTHNQRFRRDDQRRVRGQMPEGLSQRGGLIHCLSFLEHHHRLPGRPANAQMRPALREMVKELR